MFSSASQLFGFRFGSLMTASQRSAFSMGKALGHLHLAVFYDAWTVWDGFAHIMNFFFR